MSSDQLPDISQLSTDAKGRLCVHLLREYVQNGPWGYSLGTMADLESAVHEYLRDQSNLRLECNVQWTEGARGHYTDGVEHVEGDTLQAMGETLARTPHASESDVQEVRWTFSVSDDHRGTIAASYRAVLAKKRALADSSRRLGEAQENLRSRKAAHKRAVNELSTLHHELTLSGITLREDTIARLDAEVKTLEALIEPMKAEYLSLGGVL